MRRDARGPLIVDGLETARGGFRGGPYELRVEPSQPLQLVGANGSGKSTLLETIAGLLPAIAGTVRLGGTCWEGNGVRVPPWRRGHGVLLQGLGLWPHLAVGAQAGLAAPGEEERIGELARCLRLTDLLGRKPAALSGGEAQRAALLRALAPDPEVLLLDEPTSAQHEETAAVVRAAIDEEAARGKVILLATHHPWDGVPFVEL